MGEPEDFQDIVRRYIPRDIDVFDAVEHWPVHLCLVGGCIEIEKKGAAPVVVQPCGNRPQEEERDG